MLASSLDMQTAINSALRTNTLSYGRERFLLDLEVGQRLAPEAQTQFYQGLIIGTADAETIAFMKDKHRGAHAIAFDAIWERTRAHKFKELYDLAVSVGAPL